MSFFLCFSLFRSSLFLLLRLCDVKNKMIALSCSSVAMCETNFTDGTCYKCFSTALHYQLNIHNCSLSSSVEQTNKNSLFKHFFFFGLTNELEKHQAEERTPSPEVRQTRDGVTSHAFQCALAIHAFSPEKLCGEFPPTPFVRRFRFDVPSHCNSPSSRWRTLTRTALSARLASITSGTWKLSKKSSPSRPSRTHPISSSSKWMALMLPLQMRSAVS